MLGKKKAEQKRTEQEIRDALGKIDSLAGDNLTNVRRCINEWINNGYELNTKFQFSTKFKHMEKGGTFFPWEFSLLEWVGRFGNDKKLSSLVDKGLNPKFKCGGRSAFQVVLQASAWAYGGHERLRMHERVKALLDIGVEKNIVDPSERTPLDYLLRVEKRNSLTEVELELKQLLKGFLSSAELVRVKVKSTWDLQNENSALRQRVAQLECEKEELVKTSLIDIKVDDTEVGAQRG